MLRINLLPREVLEKHKYSSWYRYVFIVAAGVVIALLLVAFALDLLVQRKAEELQATQDLTAKYVEQGKAFDVFEKNENDLIARQAVAQTALMDRMNLGKVAEETSLILPDEVWLDSFTLDQKTGMTLGGNTPRSSSQSLAQSYKSVARTLVRLNQLPEVTDVWLSSASNASWNAWDTASAVSSSTPVVKFSMTAKVILPDPSVKTPTVDGR